MTLRRCSVVVGLIGLVVAVEPRPPEWLTAAELVALAERALGGPLAGASPLDVVLPASARGALRLASAGVTLDIAPLGLRDAPAERVGSALVLRDVEPDTDVVWVFANGTAEELRVLRSMRASTIARYRLSAGDARVRLRGDDVVEVLDREGDVRLATAPMYAVDAHGVHRAVHARLEGDVLVTSLDARGLYPPIVVDPAWSTIAPMSVARTQHAATLLPGDSVLITGGRDAAGAYLSSAELFDGATKTWSALPAMSARRSGHTATRLPSGKVLVTGGTSDGVDAISTAQLFDPATKTWSAAASMSSIRTEHTATLLATGKVLIAGGADLQPGGEQSSAELYDPAVNTWASAGTMAINRRVHTATLLPSGSVLVTGGRRGGATYHVNSDLFDPATGAWSPAGNMTIARGAHAAALLSSGRVLVMGGYTNEAFGLPSPSAKAELFDPATKAWTATSAPMATSRTGHSATALPRDRVLVVGGGAATVELFTLSDGRFGSFAPLAAARTNHVATLLTTGDLLVTGGSATAALASVELLTLGKPGDACMDGVVDCASGFCVDGVCCDTACNGQCEACDVAATKGTCSPVVGGPHGGRPACPIGAATCEASLCDGVTRTSCAARAGSTTVCAPAKCADGALSPEATCDGKGACSPVSARSCAPYACGDAACKTTCTSDADCSGSNLCDTSKGICIGAESTCADDGLSAQPIDRAQPAKACAPYRCDSKSGKCLDRCTTSDACGPGAVCDAPSGTCVIAPAADDGGCALGSNTQSLGGAVLTLVALIAARRRRRSR